MSINGQQYYVYILASKRMVHCKIESASFILKCTKIHMMQFCGKSESSSGKGEWQISLIEKNNPHWEDLYQDFL